MNMVRLYKRNLRGKRTLLSLQASKRHYKSRIAHKLYISAEHFSFCLSKFVEYNYGFH